MVDKYKQPQQRLIRRQLYYGVALFIMLAVFVFGYMAGGIATDWKASSMRIDITRTAIGVAQQTTINLIYASQTMASYETQLAKIQPTQTYIADTRATLEARIHPTLDD